MGSSRRKFTQEYKAEAVRLVLDSGRSVADVAKSLGINETTLGYWVKKAKEDGETDEQPLSVSERAELVELRKKYAQAQMDVAFLKKQRPSSRASRSKIRVYRRSHGEEGCSDRRCKPFPHPVYVHTAGGFSTGLLCVEETRPVATRQGRRHSPREVKAIFELNKGRYDVRRIYQQLRRQGVQVAYKRVQRLMSTLGLVSVPPRSRRTTTVQAAEPSSLPDLVRQDFTAPAPNQLWYGDISYVLTWDGWAYVASVIDAFSRKVVGWAVADHMRTDLVLDALGMALAQRHPPKGVIFHADRGSQYTSHDFVKFCKANGVRNSVGRTGICYDNAAAESFWATLKKEFIHLHPFDTVERLRSGIFEYIEVYYNRQRIHSTIGYRTPHEFELEFDRRGMLAA